MDLVLVLTFALAWEAAVLNLCESSSAGSLAGNPSVSIGAEDFSDLSIFALLGFGCLGTSAALSGSH